MARIRDVPSRLEMIRMVEQSSETHAARSARGGDRSHASPSFTSALDAGLADSSFIYEGAYAARGALSLAQRSAYGMRGPTERDAATQRQRSTQEFIGLPNEVAPIRDARAALVAAPAHDRGPNRSRRTVAPSIPSSARRPCRVLAQRPIARRARPHSLRVFHVQAGSVVIRCVVIRGRARCSIEGLHAYGAENARVTNRQGATKETEPAWMP
jgi:hypothetical protein